MPAVFAELAVRELAVSTNMKPARERFILSHRIGLILFVLDGWDINKVFFEFGTHFFRGCAWLWVLVPFATPWHHFRGHQMVDLSVSEFFLRLRLTKRWSM